MQVRRSECFTLRFEQRASLDVAAMLRGQLDVAPLDRLVATSQLTREAHALDETAIRVLQGSSVAQWEPLDTLAERTHAAKGDVEALLASGLLIGDGDEPDVRALREQEERLRSLAWDDEALRYHLASRSEDVDAWANAAPSPEAACEQSGDAPREAAERFQGYAQMTAHLAQGLQATAAWFGPAPEHFHHVEGALGRDELSLPTTSRPLFDLLERRKTTRIFDPANAMTRDELSTLLYYTYGCHGTAQLVDGLVGLRKTSPSGGALHPIEAYPLVLNVDGLETGLYHYNVEHHALDLLRTFEREEAEALAETFTVGQSYFRTAHALVLLTARFHRNFWKYRHAQKSYRVIHVDAGHLSQTFYLVATELGLGAFYTGAVNDVNIEETLGIDGVEEGVIGVSGCGRHWTDGPSLELETHDYVPRRDSAG